MRSQHSRFVGVLAPLCLLAGACSADGFPFHHGTTTHISISGDGDSSVKLSRPGYSLTVKSEGQVTFTDDESDVATLEAKGSFKLSERFEGVLREYSIAADRSGNLSREYSLDRETMPFDDAAKKWVAESLQRLFRESGFDVEARVARLLARGGPQLVLEEVDLATHDYAKATYLCQLQESVHLDAKQMASALVCAAKIQSDYELRRVLGQALNSQELDGERLTLLLKTGSQLSSDYELSELLQTAALSLPTEDSARSAWLDAAGHVDSDYELGRALHAGLEEVHSDSGYAALLIRLGAAKFGSDYELGQVLRRAANRELDATLASAYLDAVAELGSDYERRMALENVAAAVAADPELNRRFRELARTMSDYERGQALKALDDATQG